MAGIGHAARLAALSEDQVLTFFAVVVDMVRGGTPVYIRNFGTFYLRDKAPRTVQSPLIPGGVAQIPSRRVLEFRRSAKLTAEFGAGRAQGVRARASKKAPRRKVGHA